MEIANETIVKVSMDTGVCYRVKKCAEIVIKEGKMVKGEGLPVLEEKMKALDPEQNDVTSFLELSKAMILMLKRYWKG